MADGICSLDECDAPAKYRGWCVRHYTRWRRHGDPRAGRRSHLDPLPSCAVTDCTMATRRVILGLCENHYARQRRNGVPGPAELLRLNGQPEARFWPMVDQAGPVPAYRPDLGPCWIFTGSPDSRGYGSFSLDGVTARAHRFSFEHLVGPIPDGLTLDHLCRVKMCVRPTHLEPVTNAENNRRGGLARAGKPWEVL